MIQNQSVLDVADNSGAKRVMCIKVLGGSHRRYASVGDIIVVSVKEASPDGKLVKVKLLVLLLSELQKRMRRKDGSYIRFDTNAAVLINKDKEPLAPVCSVLWLVNLRTKSSVRSFLWLVVKFTKIQQL